MGVCCEDVAELQWSKPFDRPAVLSAPMSSLVPVIYNVIISRVTYTLYRVITENMQLGQPRPILMDTSKTAARGA